MVLEKNKETVANMIGHSITLQTMDITDLLLKRGNVVYDKELANNPEECKAPSPMTFDEGVISFPIVLHIKKVSYQIQSIVA